MSDEISILNQEMKKIKLDLTKIQAESKEKCFALIDLNQFEIKILELESKKKKIRKQSLGGFQIRE